MPSHDPACLQAQSLEEKLMSQAQFGENFTPLMRDEMQTALKSWIKHLHVLKAGQMPSVHYVDRHILALGDWMAGIRDYGLVWAQLADKSVRDLTVPELERVANYKLKYR